MRKSHPTQLHGLLKTRTADILALGAILTMVLAGLALLLWLVNG